MSEHNRIVAILNEASKPSPALGVTKIIVPLELVRANRYYSVSADLAIMFNHNIVELADGKWRWEPSRLAELFSEYAPVTSPSKLQHQVRDECRVTAYSQSMRASIDLNALLGDLLSGLFSIEEYMKYYMRIGYDLSGFNEIFASRSPVDWLLPGGMPAESILQYVLRMNWGQILKL